ncbi:MAG: hypothetical protein ACRDS1_07570 [Pseudonocardiaceae bacterium]
MGQATEIVRRDGAVRPELQSIVEGVDFVPERLPRTDTSAARQLLAHDGAVILTGWPEEADSVVNAAAAVLGTRGSGTAPPSCTISSRPSMLT